jgi:hypothetical protein
VTQKVHYFPFHTLPGNNNNNIRAELILLFRMGSDYFQEQGEGSQGKLDDPEVLANDST